MNFPNSVVRHVFATVALLLRCMAYVDTQETDCCNERGTLAVLGALYIYCNHAFFTTRRVVRDNVTLLYFIY